jgi:hypothetical protein
VSPASADDHQRVRQLCLENASGWLHTAAELVEATCDDWGDHRRASVLFAHAIRELGKAVELYRAELRGEHWSVAFHSDTRRYIEHATEVIDADALQIVSGSPADTGPIDDLVARIGLFEVSNHERWDDVQWTAPNPVNAKTLHNAIRAAESRVSLAIRFGMDSILLRSLSQFRGDPEETPPPREPHSIHSDVDRAWKLQAQEIEVRLSKRRRGPRPRQFTLAGLQRIRLMRDAFSPRVQEFFKQCRGLYKGDRVYWIKHELMPRRLVRAVPVC